VRTTSGPELLLAYARQSDSAVLYATRSAGSWSAPVAIGGNNLAGIPLARTP
jgi:hypothetical protein